MTCPHAVPTTAVRCGGPRLHFGPFAPFPHLQLQLLDQLLCAQCSWQVVLVAQHQQWDAVQAGLGQQRQQLLGGNLHDAGSVCSVLSACRARIE